MRDDLRLAHLRGPRARRPTRTRCKRASDAGAIVVGKTLTHEFAWGITSDNPHFPPCRNPWDPERDPGRVAAAAAASRSPPAPAALALGTDTGGSIRIPAAFCGVSGLKPTYGRIPPTGVFPLARSLDHAGPMARTPADVRLFFEALDRRRAHGEPRDAHRGLPRPAPAPARRPASSARSTHAVAALEATSSRSASRSAERIYPAFVADPDRPRPRSPTPPPFPRAGDEYGEDVAARIERARDASRSTSTPRRPPTRERIRAGFARVFAAADLLLTPIARAAAGAARASARRASATRVLPYTVPQDLAGLPTCAVPVGFDELGLPVGVQLTGPPRSEGRVLAAAEALFSATASARAGSASSR